MTKLLGLLRLNKEDTGEIGWKNRVLAVVPALRRAWEYIISHRFIRPQSQCMYSTDLGMLYNDIKSCPYEDVHVMWSILQKSQSYDSPF
uniref:Uncharacterized protein n=1 Tax=Picea sitchensis TaxID=3332 RepID=D5AC57_PICSI|nr:unknown [Picea sitchensis]